MTQFQQLFIDEIDAVNAELGFSLTLDTGKTPFQSEEHLHLGDGKTTAYYQDAKLVGFSSIFRDPLNRTMLVCIDFTR